MAVDCEGCGGCSIVAPGLAAGCCIDWRGDAPSAVTLVYERPGDLVPLENADTLVPPTSDEVRGTWQPTLGSALPFERWAGLADGAVADPALGQAVEYRGAPGDPPAGAEGDLSLPTT